jgi:hypothetical protein
MLSFLAFVPGTTWSVSLFVAICGTVVLMFLAASAFIDANRTRSVRVVIRLTVAIAMYCLLIAAIVNSGWLDRYFIPLGPLFLGSTVLLAVAVGLTPLGRSLSMGIPTGYLVGFQGFRFPLELVLHDWASTKTIPETMTWTGSNWDIATGIAALLVCFGIAKRRWLAWIFNLFGIVLLINVGRVAVLSSPVPFGWHVDPPLELILYLPYAYIVPICVGGAALGHVLLTRKLLSESKN